MDASMKVCQHCYVYNDQQRKTCWQCDRPLAYEANAGSATGTLKLNRVERDKLVHDLLDQAFIAGAPEPDRRGLHLPDLNLRTFGDWIQSHIPHHGGTGRTAGSH